MLNRIKKYGGDDTIDFCVEMMNTLKGSLWWCESQAHIYDKYANTELEKGEKEITDGRKGSQGP